MVQKIGKISASTSPILNFSVRSMVRFKIRVRSRVRFRFNERVRVGMVFRVSLRCNSFYQYGGGVRVAIFYCFILNVTKTSSVHSTIRLVIEKTHL